MKIALDFRTKVGRNWVTSRSLGKGKQDALQIADVVKSIEMQKATLKNDPTVSKMEIAQDSGFVMVDGAKIARVEGDKLMFLDKDRRRSESRGSREIAVTSEQLTELAEKIVPAKPPVELDSV